MKAYRIVRPAGLLVLPLLLALSPPMPGQLAQLGSSTAGQQKGGAHDPLGRTTPRGAVLGFLSVSRTEAPEQAVDYLNTNLRGKAATQLAHQLLVVLDHRLPANLQDISDAPEGSRAGNLKPNHELVGTISSENGSVDILLERVNRGAAGQVWLFSRDTLNAIPDLYEETELTSLEDILPSFLVTNRVAGVPLFQCLAFFVGLPLLIVTALWAFRPLSVLAGWLARRILNKPDLPNPKFLPAPARLLVVPVIIYLTITRVNISLLARQFWTGVAAILAVGSCVCLAIVLVGRAEGKLRKRFALAQQSGATSIIGFVRGTVDLLIIFIGILIILRFFGVNATAALAGLGVGGIAVALAAQKTLENVIGGFSVISDKVVHVGELLKCGGTTGTVEQIGLRSTKIRTSDRTVVSIPNGQLANLSLEDISCKDKFWFHHMLGLRYDTTASQMRSVVEELGNLLAEHPLVERDSALVRFVRFGQSSLELELVAYVHAGDSKHFLDMQNEILLRVMEIVQAAGSHIALQTPILTSVRDEQPSGTGSTTGKALQQKA